MRARGIVLFAAGLLVGAFLFYSVAWRTGALAPGHWLTRRSREIAGTSAKLPPIPTIPFPTPTPTPGILSRVSNPQAGPGASIFSRGLPTLDVAPLLLPVQGARIANLKDNFEETRGGTRRHEAIDILAPRGTPVLAAVDGTVAKLFTSQAGGLTVYEFDRSGELCYYYAHLDRYATGLAEGMALRRGDRVGEVGTSGNAPKDTPHLHFAMFRLGPDKRWWEGEAVNPYPLLLKAEER
jgi:murein DD-endopeptidase MepM/ murein hydrolase activator NlpD